MPFRAQASAVTCAANGVDLREPLNPAEPADSQAMTFPSRSVRATIVLLKLVLMCAWPIAMFLRTRRRVRPRVAAALRGGAKLLRRLLAASDGLLRALAAAGVRLRPLPVPRQATAVADPAIRPDLTETLDRLLPFAAPGALDLGPRIVVVGGLFNPFFGRALY